MVSEEDIIMLEGIKENHKLAKQICLDYKAIYRPFIYLMFFTIRDLVCIAFNKRGNRY